MPTYSWEKKSRNPFRNFKMGSGRVLSLFGILFVVGVVIASIIAWQFTDRAWYDHPIPADESISTVFESRSFSVNSGDSVRIIAEELKAAGIIDSTLFFRVYVKLFDTATLYPGNYTVIQGSSYKTIMSVLHQVESNVVRVTIPEGFSLADMGARVHATIPSISIDSWNSAVAAGGPFESDPFIVASKKPKAKGLEGYLFPDTYEFAKDATAQDVVKVMLDTMEKHIDELGAPTGDAKDMTTHEILTLSSIVEKEVRTPDSMNNVADIFLKRIAIGMALQSDATINFVIDGDDPSPTYEDLEVNSPYNTYKHPGLPPGPISAPGLNALTAVFHPNHNEYYYFLTTNAGEIYYAVTYDQHLENKRRYLK